jgi:hypothetical protein
MHSIARVIAMPRERSIERANCAKLDRVDLSPALDCKGYWLCAEGAVVWS